MTKQITNRQSNPFLKAVDSTQVSARVQGVLEAVNQRVTTARIMVGFWSMFWLLNGLDKIFNSQFFFGVTREAKFADYFARLNLSSSVAHTTLYMICIVEIILGCSYLYVLLSAKKQTLLAMLNFKLSLLIFFFFSAGDILFGDRAELWEHGTFMLLVLVSSSFYLREAEHSE